VVKNAPEGDKCTVDFFASHPASYIPKDSPVHLEVKKAHRQVIGTEAEHIVLNWHGDGTYLNMFGIPTLYYGPAGRPRTGSGVGYSVREGEHQSISDLVQCTKVYIASLLSICGSE
jgi:acetylornithine deacetylase/succinyl-diaminopimelate desuccinylase-like protein